jgi:hypothetical protein
VNSAGHKNRTPLKRITLLPCVGLPPTYTQPKRRILCIRFIYIFYTIVYGVYRILLVPSNLRRKISKEKRLETGAGKLVPVFSPYNFLISAWNATSILSSEST